MKLKQIPWKTAIGFVFIAALSVTVGRSVAAQNPTDPRASDIAAARRELTSSSDIRTELPSGHFIVGSGVIEPADRETKLSSAVAGRVARVLVREGQTVSVGDSLVELENFTELAALHVAEADERAAEADLNRVLRGSRREDIRASNEDATASRQRARLSELIAHRDAQLVAVGGTTPDELERHRLQAEVDAATARAAEARNRAVRAGSRQEDIAAARARFLAAQARREQARAVVDRLTVRAPIAGQVLQVRVRPGEYATPGGDGMIVLGDTHTLRARIDIDERDVGAVRNGMQGFVLSDAFAGQRFSGHVVEVARRMGRKNVRSDDPTERLDTKILEVVLELDGQVALIPGLRVTGYLH